MTEQPRSVGRKQREHGVISVFFALLAAAAAAILALVLHWIWNPSVDDPVQADAIVVLAYGQDRLQEGRLLAESGVSENLVISISRRMETQIEDGRLPVLSPAEVAGNTDSAGLPGPANNGGAWVEQCDTWYSDYYTWCFRPDPNTTEGEAMAVADLMAANDWDSVLVVTERSHLNRSLLIFESCVNADIYGATSTRSGPWYRDLWRSVYEVASLAKTATVGACSR